jgi:hypothetical protein
MSLDPESHQLPDFSPFNAMENNPVLHNDPDGDFIPLVVVLVVAAVMAPADMSDHGYKDDGAQLRRTAKIAYAGISLSYGAKELTKEISTYKSTPNRSHNNNKADVPKSEWKPKIEGKAQKTGTPGHQFKSYREAINAAKDPNVSKVYLDRGYNKAADLNPGTIKPNRRPDVTIIRKDGRVNVIEVKSKSDKVKNLIERNNEAMKKLPESKQGNIKVVEPNRSR